MLLVRPFKPSFITAFFKLFSFYLICFDSVDPDKHLRDLPEKKLFAPAVKKDV